jgi:hypothetical protein
MGNAAGDYIQKGLNPVGQYAGKGLETVAKPVGGLVEPLVGGIMKSGEAFGEQAGVGFGNKEGGREYSFYRNSSMDANTRSGKTGRGETAGIEGRHRWQGATRRQPLGSVGKVPRQPGSELACSGATSASKYHFSFLFRSFLLGLWVYTRTLRDFRSNSCSRACVNL